LPLTPTCRPGDIRYQRGREVPQGSRGGPATAEGPGVIPRVSAAISARSGRAASGRDRASRLLASRPPMVDVLSNAGAEAACLARPAKSRLVSGGGRCRAAGCGPACVPGGSQQGSRPATAGRGDANGRSRPVLRTGGKGFDTVVIESHPLAREVHLKTASDEDDKPPGASDEGDRSGPGAGRFGP
jgi:hypothetical protein